MTLRRYYTRVTRYQRAERRAARLLDSHMTKHQRQTWADKGYMDVKGSRAGHFRLFRRWDECTLFAPSRRFPARRLCTVPMTPTVLDDFILAHKLWIESNEHAFLLRACPSCSPVDMAGWKA